MQLIQRSERDLGLFRLVRDHQIPTDDRDRLLSVRAGCAMPWRFDDVRASVRTLPRSPIYSDTGRIARMSLQISRRQETEQLTSTNEINQKTKPTQSMNDRGLILILFYASSFSPSISQKSFIGVSVANPRWSRIYASSMHTSWWHIVNRLCTKTITIKRISALKLSQLAVNLVSYPANTLPFINIVR